MRFAVFSIISLFLLGGCTPSTQSFQSKVYQRSLDSAFVLLDKGFLDSALHSFKACLEHPGGTDVQVGINHNAIAGIYYKKPDYPHALREYLMAQYRFLQAGDSINVANTDLNIGLCYKKLGLFDKSVEHLQKAHIYFIRFEGNEYQISSIATLLGNIYRELENYPLSLEYHYKAISVQRNTPGLDHVPSLNNLGNTYYRLEGQVDTALWFYNNYLEESMYSKDTIGIIRAFQNIARTRLVGGDITQAKRYLDSSRIMSVVLMNTSCNIDQNLIDAEVLALESPNKALELAQLACQQAKMLSKTREWVDALTLVEQLQLRLGEPAKAYQTAQTRISINDSLDDKRKIAQIYGYELTHQTALKNYELQQEREHKSVLKLTRNLLYFIAFLLASLLYLLYLRYRAKQKFVDEYFSSETGVILKSGKRIEFNDIVRVETQRNDLIILHLKGRIIQKNTTLKSFEPALPKIQFGRPQRGIIINFQHVTRVWKTKVDLLEKSINISDKYKEEFLERWQHYQRTIK